MSLFGFRFDVDTYYNRKGNSPTPYYMLQHIDNIHVMINLSIKDIII